MKALGLRRVIGVEVVLGLVVAASAALWLQGGSSAQPAAANGTPGSSGSVAARTLKTIVLPGEILADQDEASFPFTVTMPLTEGVAEFKVPMNSRLVIESAYATLTESYSDPAMRRTGFSPGFRTFYPLPGCAFLGYERDYGMQVGPGAAAYDETTYTASLEGPIYVEGGRVVGLYTSAVGGNSQVIVYVTLHGYLEPATNPSNPRPPTTVCD